MASITIAKKHALSHKKAKEIADRIAKDLQRRFELDYAWEGDHVDFERPGVSGRMRVGRTDIALDVHLGFLLTALKPAIEREIHAQLATLIDAGKGGTKGAGKGGTKGAGKGATKRAAKGATKRA